jgi:tetratricopeptide (TPR) repeat protein
VLEQGIKEFNAKRYHHAQEVFEKAISMNPRSAEAYANLAGTLLMLKDKQSAQECFKACYALHPFGKLGEYAREQILKLVQEDAYAKTDPQDSPQTVARTVALINRQSADRARAAQASASITARNRLTLADIEIQKMTAETRQALADFRANRGYYQYYRNGRMHNQRGTVDQYDQQEISNLDYIRTNYLRTDGQVQANLAMNDGYMRASSAYDSATNLKEQLLQPVAPGGAHLRALGTSLYARYYGDGSPSTEDPPVVDAPLPGLLATPKAYNTH